MEAETVQHGRPRLIVMTAPAELPAGPDRTWLRLRDHGQRVSLEVPDSPDYFGRLLAGGAGKSITELYAREPYDSWAISASKPLAAGQLTVQLSLATRN